MGDLTDTDIYSVRGRPGCACRCGCARTADVLVYADTDDGDSVNAMCAWCAVRFDSATANARSVVNAWDVKQWCYSSREDWLADAYRTRALFAFAYRRIASQILGPARVRDGAGVEATLSFLGNGNWSMLAERRAAYFIEHPAVDPQTRPKTLDLYDTGERHSGQLDPEPPLLAWRREVAPTIAADQPRLRVLNA